MESVLTRQKRGADRGRETDGAYYPEGTRRVRVFSGSEIEARKKIQCSFIRKRKQTLRKVRKHRLLTAENNKVSK